MAKQDDFIRTALRVPPELHSQLHASATEAGRTFNAEIVSRLEESFRDRTNPSDETWNEMSSFFTDVIRRIESDSGSVTLALAKYRAQYPDRKLDTNWLGLAKIVTDFANANRKGEAADDSAAGTVSATPEKRDKK